MGADGGGSLHRILRIEKFDGQVRSQLKIDRAMLQQAHVVGQAFDRWIVMQKTSNTNLLTTHG